ncbi:hypothetical protein M1P56_21240 [Streptomyces sp. HU2014]|uniref:hypothetical protein n=1 Tax=Streptomyces sp. HU2014 TaxID=2939414 RepID=UPI00200CF3E9|nr:hypothetical protein [Streptomyces sp. HU2014]UQI46693.1 hypothetical protein M1P56_21240 [Streptomyces sp. HU2014]
MRDRIAHLAAWLRALIFPTPGRHSATYLCHTHARPTPDFPAPQPSPEPATVDDFAHLWATGPLIRSHVLAHEEEQRQQRLAEERLLRAHRRAALAAAVRGWERLDAEAEGWVTPAQPPAASGDPAPGGWDYPEALYIDPGTGLRTVRVRRDADGSAVLA